MGQSPKQMWDSPCWSALGFAPLLFCPEHTKEDGVALVQSNRKYNWGGQDGRG